MTSFPSDFRTSPQHYYDLDTSPKNNSKWPSLI